MRIDITISEAMEVIQETMNHLDEKHPCGTLPGGKLVGHGFIRSNLAHGILGTWRKQGIITEDAQESLIDQLQSPDREAWYVVFSFMIQLYKQWLKTQ